MSLPLGTIMLIVDNMFIPNLMQVTAITQAIPAVVTTASNHNLITGQKVRLLIPYSYGMQQVNKQIFSITVLTPTTFSLQFTQTPYTDVNSIIYDPFVNLGTGTPAQATCIGDGATPLITTPPSITNNVAISSYDNATYNASITEVPFDRPPHIY